METKYITWNPETGFEPGELETAAEILRHGGLVAFPTETVYGLGGNGLSKKAAKSIYAAKGRPSDNPLILHISEFDELDGIVQQVPHKARLLMEAFWPGPMTLIFDKSTVVPLETTGGLPTVAVRMPSHEGARALIRAVGIPIAAPSANTSGRPSPTLAEHVREDLDGKIDMIIDGGAVGIGVESTIIDVTQDVPVILRPGYITKDMIEGVVGAVKVDPAIVDSDSKEPPKAPGMKYRHYAPKAEMIVFEGTREEMTQAIAEHAAQYPEEKVGILASEETKDCYSHGQVVVAGSREKQTITRGLFAALRQFDHLGVEKIFAESFSEEEKSEAIMNRLLKAAGQHIEYLSEPVDYHRLIFICKENVSLSPMAEWIMKSIVMDKSREILSRGLVVLFPEPRNAKVTDVLVNHGVPCEEQTSTLFTPEEVDDRTLVVTMNFTEKVRLLEDFDFDSEVFTLREIADPQEGAEMDPDVMDPYGGDEEAYEESYIELKDLLYKLKKQLEWS